MAVHGEFDADTWVLQVSVRDTNSGIRAEDIPKLFQSFQLLDMMDSKLEVDGNYEARHLKQLDSSARKKFLLAAGAKILVVDDNDMNLKVISGLLKRNRIVPDLADSGNQCLELAAKNFCAKASTIT